MSGAARTIFHLITGLESGGGAETFLGRILPRVQHHEPVVCSMRPPGGIRETLQDAGIPVYSLQMKYKYDPRGIFRYRKHLKRRQPDAQINYLFHADVFGRVFGNMFGVPSIISFLRNKHQNWHYRLLERCTLPLADCLLANSEAVMTYYQEQYTLPDCRYVIPNGIPLPEPDLQTGDWQEEIISDEQFVVTSVARLHPQKCLDALIKAVQLVQDDISDLQVLLVGEGEQREELQALVSRMGLEEDVQFLGYRDDVYHILSRSDVFVLPSQKEGMSNALLEAMASGLACVVSDIPENKELITDRSNGLTFRLNDADDLARKLFELHDRPALRDQYGKEAKDLVTSKYTVDATVETFEQTIDHIV